MADPLYHSIIALLPFDGANNDVVFPDASFNASVFTPFGNAKLSTTQSKFGATSLYLDGTGDYLYSPADVGFMLGAADFTIEMWVYLLSYGTGAHMSLVDLRPYGAGAAALYYLSGGKMICYDGGTFGGTGSQVPLNAWTHLAFTRENGVLRAFIGGVLQWSASGSASLGTIVPPMFVGGDYQGNNTVHGYMDDLRITKFVARYTANYTPPGAHDTGTLALTYTLLDSGKVTVFTPLGVLPRLLTAVILGKDVNHGGMGRVSGTTKIDGTPTDTPVGRRVRLYREKDGLLVREQWSNSTTGAYSFDYIDPAFAYTVITYDHLHTYRAEAADNITPDIIT